MNSSIDFLKLTFISDGSYWTKVLYADRQNSSIPIGQRLKAKNYEITNPQIISWGDRHHWSHIEFYRIRAAGAIAGDDDHDE
jgi:hypothetical protein